MYKIKNYSWSYSSSNDTTQGGGTQDDNAVLGVVSLVELFS
jgi:hypothetical protein